MTARARRAIVRRALGAWAVALVVALGPSRAWADPPPAVRLALVRAPGAEGCPDAAAVAADVAARLGASPFDPAAPRAIDVIVTRDAAGFHARVLVREALASPPAVRDLASDAPDCAELADSLALVTALAIDPNAPLGPRPAAPAPPPRPVPRAPTTPTPPRPAPVAPPRVRPADPAAWDARTRVQLAAGVGLGPQPGVPLALAWGLRTPRLGPLRGTLDAWLLPETRTDDQRFGFGLTAASVGACLGTASARFAIDGCVEALAGVLHGVPRRPPLVPEQPGDYAWVAAGLSLRGALRLFDPLALEVRIEPIVPVLHHRFVILGDATPVFETSYVALFAVIGLSARLP